MLIAFIVLVCSAYFQVIFVENILGLGTSIEEKSQSIVRVSGMFGSEQILGSYLSKMLPLLLGLFFLDLKNKQRLHFFLFFILISTMIFLSGSRSSIIYHILSIIFIFFLIDQWKKIFLNTTLILLIVIITIGLNNEQSKKRIYDSLKDTGLIIDEHETNSQFENMNQYSKPPYVRNHDFGFGKNKRLYLISPAYHSHFKSAYLMFRDNPLFGKGTKMFRYECNDGKFKNFTDFHIHPDYS